MIIYSHLHQKWQKDGVADGNPLPRSSFNRHRDAILDMFGIEVLQPLDLRETMRHRVLEMHHYYEQ